MTGYPVIGPVRITAGLGLAGPVGTWVFNLTYPGGSQSGRQVHYSCPVVADGWSESFGRWRWMTGVVFGRMEGVGHGAG